MGGCDLVVVIRLLGADIGQIHLGGDAFQGNFKGSAYVNNVASPFVVH